MPYIKPKDRELYDNMVLELGKAIADLGNAGELNYCITQICHRYIHSALSYATINEVIGVLECAKLELYRMIAAPYEDNKIADNGYVSKLDEGLNE